MAEKKVVDEGALFGESVLGAMASHGANCKVCQAWASHMADLMSGNPSQEKKK